MSPRKKPVTTSVDVEVTDRDYVMARLAAARASAQAALESIDEMLGLFVEPEEDPKGKQRDQIFEAASDALGAASRSLEAAQLVWDESDDIDPAEGEDYDDAEGDEDDEEDEEEDE